MSNLKSFTTLFDEIFTYNQSFRRRENSWKTTTIWRVCNLLFQVEWTFTRSKRSASGKRGENCKNHRNHQRNLALHTSCDWIDIYSRTLTQKLKQIKEWIEGHILLIKIKNSSNTYKINFDELFSNYNYVEKFVKLQRS